MVQHKIVNIQEQPSDVRRADVVLDGIVCESTLDWLNSTFYIIEVEPGVFMIDYEAIQRRRYYYDKKSSWNTTTRYCWTEDKIRHYRYTEEGADVTIFKDSVSARAYIVGKTTAAYQKSIHIPAKPEIVRASDIIRDISI